MPSRIRLGSAGARVLRNAPRMAAGRANIGPSFEGGVRRAMRPSVRRSVLWLLPLLVLAAAVAIHVGAPNAADGLRALTWKILAPLATQPLERPPFADRAEEILLALAGLAMIAMFARLRTGWAAFVYAAAAILAGVAAWRLATAQGLFVDAGYPVVGLTAVFLAGAITPMFAGANERAQVKRSLETHVAPSVMAAIERTPEVLKLGGETRTMSYLVCGIRRYPQLVQAFADEPEILRRITRKTLTALSDTVLKYHGTVDRVLPGGLTAFFNAPLEDAQHAIHACECALSMTRALESVSHAFEQERRKDGTPYPPIEIGVGVHTGPGVVGDFGTDARAEYTVAGLGVVLAGEIEELSSKYGPAIVATEATRLLAERNFAFLEVDTVITPNAEEPVKIYALIGNPLMRASPKYRALATFHEHIFQSYRACQWAKARALIEQCRKLSGASPQLYDLYLNRIAYYEAHPPGENWNGAVNTPIV